ncbi:MAG: substrate-binding domain-containing protein [Spirochaetales bacterium]|nr:substrate-binding domain-containing protein [Spirochaetales bacterium]
MNKRPRIGFYIPNLIGEYFENQWFIINQAAIEADVNLIIFSPLMFITNSEYQKMYSHIFDYGGKENVDGLIISTASFHCYFENREINKLLTNNTDIPIVSIGELIPGISSILIDNYTGMKELVRHFIKDHGYKRVAFIRGKEGNKEGYERFAAYKDVLIETGIPYDEQLIIQGDFGIISGKKAVDELLDVRQTSIDAVIAANDDMILGVYTEMQKRGINVPREVALGGFDNIKAIRELPCPITTVQQAIDEQIKMALDLVLDLIKSKKKETHILLPSHIVIRESCGCPGHDNNEGMEENIYQALRKMVENQGKYANTQQGYSVGLLSSFFTCIINANDFDVIKLQCDKLFAEIGINSCLLAFYNKGLPLFIEKDAIPPLFSEIFLLYQDHSGIKEYENNYSFKTKELSSDILFKHDCRHTLLFSELIFQNEFYGFVLLEMSNINPLVINLFKIQFANSLHNIYTRHEIEKAYKKLEEAKISAESANKLKSRFLANMSHEIRTPMNAVLGFINILIEQETDDVKLDYMRIINDSGKTLLHLINDILDISKIEAGLVDLVETEIYIPHLFGNLNDLFEIEAKEKGISMEIHLDVSVPRYVIGDEIRIRQILTNIIGNAIKFTNRGSVTITATFVKNEFIVIIKDTGIGIPKDKLSEIFSPFKQQDATIQREYGGTGLGLTIARSFTERMGGSLKAKSRTGEGSTFTLILPLKIPPEEKVQADKKKVADPVSSDYSIHEDHELITSTSDFPVLVADDNEVSRKLLGIYLRELNVKVYFAENGVLVPDLLHEKKIKLLLMDIKMPVMDGITAITLIRKNKEFDAIYTIALTAYAVKGEDKKYLEIGFDDYISKPIDKNHFQHKIKQLLHHAVSGKNISPGSKRKNKENNCSSPDLTEVRIKKLNTISLALEEAASIFNEKEAYAILRNMEEFKDIPAIAELYYFLKKSISEYNSEALGSISRRIRKMIDDRRTGGCT